MSHFVTLVVTEHGTEEEVNALLAPYEEQLGDNPKWDWFQIGGRWRGMLDPAYDQDKDPSLKETCTLCEGTGTRKDMKVENGCNACHGTGIRQKWPTQWKPHEHDTVQIKELQLDKVQTPFAVLTSKGWFERGEMGWFAMVENEQDSEEWKKAVLKILEVQNPDHFITVVDCHI